jgi:esterase/lipase
MKKLLGLLSFILMAYSSISSAQSRGELLRAWEAFKNDYSEYEVQQHCEHTFYSYNQRKAYKGAVLLLHGYTACPQQYFELGKRLSDNGYDVLMPLSPGHGQVLAEDGRDQHEYMPVYREEYMAFSERLNDVMGNAAGEKVIGGLSVGGALATYALNMAPHQYDRALIMAPFYKIKNAFQQNLMMTLTYIPFIRQYVVSWGDECKITERNAGRAGICDFRLRHMNAVQRFGAYVVNSVDAGVAAKIQFVGVENDDVINTGVMKQVTEAYPEETVNKCLLLKGASHSLLSRYDSPNQHKFWLDGFLDAAEDFIVSGKNIATREASIEKGFSVCDIHYAL